MVHNYVFHNLQVQGVHFEHFLQRVHIRYGNSKKENLKTYVVITRFYY